MGVYGDFLGVFAELMEEYDVVECTPNIGAGYDTKPIGKIQGYIQDGESGLNVRDNYSRNASSAGSASGVVSQFNVCYLYTREPIKLYDNFLMYKGSPYRSLTDSDYRKEGDLVVTELHKVVGNTVNEMPLDIVIGVFD